MSRRRPKNSPGSTGGQFAKDTRGADPKNIPTANGTTSAAPTAKPDRSWAEMFHIQLEEARARMLARRDEDNAADDVDDAFGDEYDDASSDLSKCFECNRTADEVCSECGEWVCTKKRCEDDHEKHCRANEKIRILSRHSCAQLKTTKADYYPPFVSRSQKEKDVLYRKRLKTAFMAPVITGRFSPNETLYVSFIDMDELDPTNYNDDADYRFGHVLRMNVRIREDAVTGLELLPNPAGNPKWRIADKGCTTSTFIRRGTSEADLEEIAAKYAAVLEEVLEDPVAYRKQFNFLSYLDSMGDNLDVDTWSWGMSLQ